MPAIRIGISGWRYEPWRGVFYPDGLPQAEELAFAAAQLLGRRWQGGEHRVTAVHERGHDNAKRVRDRRRRFRQGATAPEQFPANRFDSCRIDEISIHHHTEPRHAEADPHEHGHVDARYLASGDRAVFCLSQEQ